MGKQDRFTDELKRDAVTQVVDRGYPVREEVERLGISTKSIYTWQPLFSRPVKLIREVDAQADEIRRPKRDLARVADLSRTGKQSGGCSRGEWGHLKTGDRILRQQVPVRSAFIA